MITRISLLLFLNLTLNCVFIEATYSQSTTYSPRSSTSSPWSSSRSSSSSSNCKRKTPDLNGIIVPVFTPYKKNNNKNNNNNTDIDYDMVEVMAQDYAKKGIKIIAVAEKVGEGYLLSLEECKALYKAWVVAARRCGLLVIVVVGDPTPTGLELAGYADSIGVDAIMTLLPLYYRPMSTKPALADMKLIANCAKNTPIILYVDPSTKPECVRIDQLYDMATKEICNFAGIRCSLEVGLQICAAGLYKPYQYIFITNHAEYCNTSFEPDSDPTGLIFGGLFQYSIAPATFLGFNGSVTVANTIAPKMALKIRNAQSLDEALVYQEKINELIRRIAPDPRTYIGATKAAYYIITDIYVGGPRPPIEGVSCQYQIQITKNLQQIRYPIKHPVLSCGGSSDDENNDEDCMEQMEKSTPDYS